MIYRIVTCCLGTALISLVLSGCELHPSLIQDSDASAATYVIPDDSPVTRSGTAAMLQKQQLLVRYHVDSGPLQAITTIESKTGDLLSVPGRTLPVKTLRVIPDDEWENLTAGSLPVVVRGPEAWHSLLNSSLQVLTPEVSGSGVCVDILQQKELFLYRDENSALVYHGRHINDRPRAPDATGAG